MPPDLCRALVMKALPRKPATCARSEGALGRHLGQQERHVRSTPHRLGLTPTRGSFNFGPGGSSNFGPGGSFHYGPGGSFAPRGAAAVRANPG